ncbi:TonB-dependent receptor [Brevundimonas sp. 2R-24]|uniref:TonB-dependent receptor n=1 Tax=Peiella sedimenti TaxID=3061083 RepID=A0ABT8SL85_9CAUL|nr:TonB-dependent receptor [Caulobacteraceae bacterium XZ-24]
MRSFKILLLATAAFCAPCAALAQATQPSPPSPPPARSEVQDQEEAPPPEQEDSTAVGEVVVTARANDIRTSIDSISYSVTEDLQAASGTLADALRNIPSVDVDPQGNVSLRGDSGVVILVDGRPSGMLTGESRAQALLQLPADQYARIEVMTNPSAAYRPDGAGGVINLITRPTAPRRGATYSGSVRANVGNDGRYNYGANLAYTRDRLTLSGDVGVRHDAVRQESSRFRERYDPVSDLWLPSTQTQTVDGESDGLLIRLSAEYRVDDATQVTGEVRHNHFESNAFGLDLLESEDALGGVASSFRRSGDGGFSGDFSGATARLLRQFGEGHEWTNELRYDHGHGKFYQDGFVETLVPAAPPSWELLDNENIHSTLAFTSAYNRPLPGDAKLRAGYEFERFDMDFSTILARGPTEASATPDPLISNQFIVEQTVHALYATYERPFGDKLTAQFGLRLEQVLQDMDQVTSGTTDENDYFSAYPTLHVSYDLGDNQTLRGSYSRRVQRPQPFDLNPFLIYTDAVSYRSGNPDLEPQVTDSWELMWQRRVDQTFYQATLYYRDTTDAFTYVVTDMGGILVTRPENLGARSYLGLELVANGRLHPTLRYNASLSIFQQEIEAAGVPGGQDRSGTGASGRLSLNWQPTPDDFLQVSGLWIGETIGAQGTREGGQLINLGYRRKLTDRWAVQVTVRDLFDEFGEVVTYETPTLRDTTERLFGGRMSFIGLTYTFGNGQRREQPPAFDFSAPPTGG